MPAPKIEGHLAVSKGVTFNKRFNFWTAFKCFNQKNVPDKRDFFLTKEEALQATHKQNA